ncbi:aromatase/cyclase [Umezawaea beigongshangensis]|uniref:aromatase/cyclase n=1 Tax=Umezawaea beigongshangensis TaxID=2780383 RepID=UPI0018F1481F|nr:aromatase/cyclase [Umezawaea beigongshangensis]
MSPAPRHTAHSLVVAAPADRLYALVADVTRWPVIFEPSVHVQHLERGERAERFRLWALVGGEVLSWTSRRELDRAASRIAFRQERSQAPVASMGGVWRFTPLPGGRTEVVLEHDFTAVDDESAERVALAVDGNSTVELAALARIAEQDHAVDDLVFSFEDTVRSPGSAADAYEFVQRADAWPDRLPHVRRVDLREDVPGVQHVEMDTVTGDGAAHTTRSVRLCFEPSLIVYKQLVPPAILRGHSGSWAFEDTPDGVVVTARHTVAVDPAAVPEVLGSGRTVADAARYLREALGRNSLATLNGAGAHAGARRS